MTVSTSERTPRGIRNNNPGNLRRNGDPWQGLAERQGDVEFFTFKSAIYGIRALARTLIAYQDKHGLRTIRQIISRWAPPNENNTNAYIRAVAADTGQDADQILDMHRFDHLLPLTKAMVEANRARFTISSTPGEGTLVEIAFPTTRVLAG